MTASAMPFSGCNARARRARQDCARRLRAAGIPHADLALGSAAMAETPLYVGIDLGTTNSAAAVFDGERVAVVRNAQGASVTPSVVRIDKQGRVTVGTRARRFLEQDPANTATEFKRLMGTDRAIEFPAARS